MHEIRVYYAKVHRHVHNNWQVSAYMYIHTLVYIYISYKCTYVYRCHPNEKIFVLQLYKHAYMPTQLPVYLPNNLPK